MFNRTRESLADEQLMLLAQRGDLAAFEQLYRKYAPRLINFAGRFVGRRELAEELTQEILLKVYDHRDQYQPSAKFSTWLYTVATNHCLNETRKAEYAQRPLSLSDLAEVGFEPAAAESEQPERTVLRQELTRLVAREFQQLPDTQRAALSLLIDEGLSYAEIAAVLNVSPAAVKSLISRARENLKGRLSATGERE